MRAVLLLSGGLDSATVLAIARSQGFEIHALSFRYGQRHQFEIDAARRVASAAGVARHVILDIDLRVFGGSALTDSALEVPKSTAPATGEVPITYVPARNTIFLSFALAFAEVLDARDIFLGVNAVDYSGYPDCRPEYLAAFQTMANLATRAGVAGQSVRIHAPLIDLSKARIIRRGIELGVDYALTHSCYDPDSAGRACRTCDACRLRLAGFAECGLADPIPYQV